MIVTQLKTKITFMEQKTNHDLLSFKAQLKFCKLASSGNYLIKNLFLQQMKIQQKFGD